MADDVIAALAQLETNLTIRVEELVGKQVGKLRDEMNAGFDRVYVRLDRIESELAVKAG